MFRTIDFGCKTVAIWDRVSKASFNEGFKSHLP
jgi:hypothetical protein